MKRYDGNNLIIANVIVAFVVLMCLLCRSITLNAQTNTQLIDSLTSEITSTTPDSIKRDIYYQLAKKCKPRREAKEYALKSLQYCKKTDTIIIVDNYCFLLSAYLEDYNIKEALDISAKALQLINHCSDTSAIPCKLNLYSYLSRLYKQVDKYDTAIMYTTISIDLARKTHNYPMLCEIYFSLVPDLMERHFVDIAQLYLDSVYIIGSQYNLNLYTRRALLMQAFSTFEENNGSLKYVTEALHLIKQAEALCDTVDDLYHAIVLETQSIYMELAHITNNPLYADSCYQYILKTGNYYLDNPSYTYLLLVYNYCDYLVFYNHPKQAIEESKKCIPYLKEDIDPLYFSVYYKIMTNIYKHIGDYKTALKYLEKDHVVLQYVNRESVANDIADFKSLLFAKQLSTIKQIEQHDLELQNQHDKKTSKIILLASIIALVIFLLMTFLLLRAFIFKRRANKILSFKNNLLQQQQEEIEVQRDVLSNQNQSLEKLNRNILASVNYAKRIQHAAMPSNQQIKALFPNSFVCFTPISIVSCDFYFATEIEKCKVLIVAGCSVQGIPGGFLSMLGIFGLKEFVRTKNDAQNPNIILSKLDTFVNKSIAAQSFNNNLKSGIDMSICSILPNQSQLRFAAANQKVIAVCNGNLNILDGNNVSLGVNVTDSYKFETSEIDITKGDIIYMFTDGIEPYNTDFTKMIKQICNLPIDEQNKITQQQLNQWYKQSPPNDDLTIIGVQI